MASLYGAQSNRGWYLQLDYNVRQDVQANKSTIDCTLYVYNATGSSWNEYPNEAYYKIYNSGVIYQIYNFGSTGWYTLGSYSFTVEHESDGSKQITLSAEWCSENPGSAYTPYLLTLSETVTLPKIPRATRVSTKGPSVTIGETCNIMLTQYLNNVNHKILYIVDKERGEIEAGFTGTQIRWETPETLLYAMPNKESVTGSIVCETYAGEKLVGTTSTPVRFVVSEDIKPTISSVELVYVNENEWLEQENLCVEGYTRVRVCTAAAAGTGSKIKTISIEGIGNGSGEEWTSGVLPAGEQTVIARVKDTRGRDAVLSSTLMVKPYAKPVVTQLNYERGNYESGVWSASVSGTDIKITCATDAQLEDDGNVAVLELALHKVLDDEAPVSTIIYEDSCANGEEVYYVEDVETDTTCMLIATVTDLLGNSGTKEIELSTAEVPLNINFETLGICVGGVAEKEKTFQIKWPVDMDQNKISNLKEAEAEGDALAKGYVVPVAEGGTGERTAEAALSALGALNLKAITDEEYVIKEAVDLNSFVTPGTFCCMTSTTTKTLSNKPSYSDAGFRLIVSYNNNSDSIIQVILFESADGHIFYRFRSGANVWGQWKEIASTASAPAKHFHYKYLGVGTAGYGSTFTLSNSDGFSMFCILYSYNGYYWTGLIPIGERVATPVYGDYWPFQIARSGSNIVVSGPGDASFYVYVYGIV